jgi:hypothetical protein
MSGLWELKETFPRTLFLKGPPPFFPFIFVFCVGRTTIDTHAK